MAIVKKISELTPKGSPLANTDLLIVGVDNGTDYDLKSVTGAQVLGNVVSQTITDGVTTKSPSENVLFDALALKVDKVAGSRLITSAEATILGNTSGTNTGDQNLQSVTNLGATTSNAISTQNATFQSSLAPSQIQTQRLSNSKRSSLNADGFITFSTTGTAEATLKATNILNDVTLEVPNKSVGSYTIATTSDLDTKVPYTGATQNVDLGEFELKAGQLSLDITPTGTSAVGTTRWNDDLGSSETTLKGGSVILKNGVDLVARVVNKVTPNTTLTKANYQVVKISGAQGQRLAVNLAQANNDNNSADTLGIVCETIATNQEGFIITVGQLENVNTTGSLQSETWVDGDVLYLSPTTAGRITNVKPTGATGHIVVLGYVEYAHAVNGKIYVKIMNGWELDELHNVSISNPLDKQLLSYENSTSLWKNKSVTTADIADSTNKRYVTDANLTVIGNTSGSNTGDQIISDATITTSDITTNDVSITKHGFAPKAPNNTTQFLRGDGTWATPSAGGLTFFSEAQNTTAPNATVPVDSLTAVTGTTDGDFAIIPKGAGALTSQVSDGTTTGGNKRGARAVDFQRSRAGATQVASGADSVILSGVNNVASNTYGVVLGGSGNLTSAQYTLAFGRNAYITGNYAFEFGNNGGGTAHGGFGFLSAQTGSNAVSFHGAATGTNSFTKTGTASGLNSVAFSGTSSGAYSFTANASNLSNSRASSIFGELGSTKGVATRISLSCYQNISPYIAGNSQASIGAVTTQTTTNTAISLLTYNGTVISLPLQDNEAIRVRGSIIGKQTASVNVCCYDFDCVIVRGVGVATTVLKVNNMNLVFDDIVCTVLPTLNADTANGGLDIKSGGKVTTTIKWVARIDSTESILA